MKNNTLRLSTVSKAFMLALLLCGMGMTKGFAFIDFSVGGVSYHIITNTNTVEVTANSNPGYSGYVNIPSTVTYQGTTYTVVGIEAGAFLEETLVTDVSIPESVTYIGTNAFYGCHVRNLMIRSWSLTIGNGAFADANRAAGNTCEFFNTPAMCRRGLRVIASGDRSRIRTSSYRRSKSG